jgi:hypothetical protein
MLEPQCPSPFSRLLNGTLGISNFQTCPSDSYAQPVLRIIGYLWSFQFQYSKSVIILSKDIVRHTDLDLLIKLNFLRFKKLTWSLGQIITRENKICRDFGLWGHNSILGICDYNHLNSTFVVFMTLQDALQELVESHKSLLPISTDMS